MLLGKDKLNTIEFLISKALIDSYVSHDELVSVNNVLRVYYEMKKEIKNLETSVECIKWNVNKWNILLANIQVPKKLNKID